MLLKELFEKSEAETPDTLVDDIAFYCDHDDDLHKEYFLPAVDELKRKKIFDVEQCYSSFMPMVEAGCEKYDEKFKVAGVYEEVYTKELKEKVCRRIAEKHLQHIEDGAYDPQEA